MMYTRHNFDMGAGRGRPVSEVPADNRFGVWLRAARTARGLTGEALSFLTNGGVTQASISHYERGTKSPEARTVVLIANALGVDSSEALKLLALGASDVLMADTPGLEPQEIQRHRDPESQKILIDFTDAFDDLPLEIQQSMRDQAQAIVSTLYKKRNDIIGKRSTDDDEVDATDT